MSETKSARDPAGASDDRVIDSEAGFPETADRAFEQAKRAREAEEHEASRGAASVDDEPTGEASRAEARVSAAATDRPARPWFQMIAAIVVLAVAGGGTALLRLTAAEPERRELTTAGPSVAVTEATRVDAPVRVRGHGTVRAAREVAPAFEVGGRVAWVSPSFRGGRSFEANQLLATLVDVDYQLALRQAEAERGRAEATFDTASANVEEAEAAAAQALIDAQRIRQLFETGTATQRELDNAELALDQATARRRAARASAAQAASSLKLAEVAVEQAEVNLSRTELRLPFAGRVLSESLQVGQYVTPGQTVGQVHAVDELEIVTPLSDGQLRWFEMPSPDVGAAAGPDGSGTPPGSESRAVPEDVAGELPGELPGEFPGDVGVTAGPAESTGSRLEPGPRAWVTARFAGEQVVHAGRVTRLDGQIDPVTRMAPVVVTVTGESASRLRPGQFVSVAIEGVVLESVTPLPMRAMRPAERDVGATEPAPAQGERVWLVDDDQRLRIQPVELVRRSSGVALVRGLSPGARVILTPLDVVTDGMEVRVEQVSPAPALPGRGSVEASLADEAERREPEAPRVGVNDRG